MIAAGLALGAMSLALMACDTTKPAVPPRPSMPVVIQADQPAEVALKPMKILAVGDSITVGSLEGSWRDGVDAGLRARGFEPIWVVAAAAGSRCTTWAGMFYSLLIANQPDIVLISCGTNEDMSTKSRRATFESAHMSMIKTGRDFGVKVAVSTIQASRTTGRPDLAWLAGFEAQTNPILRANAGFYGDVAFADFEAIPATPENNPDGVHPGPAGQALYAAAWLSAGARQGWWAS